MTCDTCRKAAVVSLRTGQYCRKCFIRLIEKRVRKHVRLTRLFKPHDEIVCHGPLSEHLVRSIMGDIPCSIRHDEGSGGGVHLYERTLDDEAYAFLQAVFSGKASTFREVPSVLSVLTDEEASAYAEQVGASFEPLEKNTDIKAFLEPISERYPETKFSLRKSMRAYTAALSEDSSETGA